VFVVVFNLSNFSETSLNIFIYDITLHIVCIILNMENPNSNSVTDNDMVTDVDVEQLLRSNVSRTRRLSWVESDVEQRRLAVLDIEQLVAQDDASAWLQRVVGIEFGRDSDLFTSIANGVVLLKLVKRVDPSFVIPPMLDTTLVQTDAASFLARDNISLFLKKCQEFGVPKLQLFDVEDLADRRNDRSVVNTLMHLAKVLASRGIEPPELVQAEIDIENEQFDDEEQQHNAHGDPTRPSTGRRASVVLQERIEKIQVEKAREKAEEQAKRDAFRRAAARRVKRTMESLRAQELAEAMQNREKIEQEIAAEQALEDSEAKSAIISEHVTEPKDSVDVIKEESAEDVDTADKQLNDEDGNENDDGNGNDDAGPMPGGTSPDAKAQHRAVMAGQDRLTETATAAEQADTDEFLRLEALAMGNGGDDGPECGGVFSFDPSDTYIDSISLKRAEHSIGGPDTPDAGPQPSPDVNDISEQQLPPSSRSSSGNNASGRSRGNSKPKPRPLTRPRGPSFLKRSRSVPLIYKVADQKDAIDKSVAESLRALGSVYIDVERVRKGYYKIGGRFAHLRLVRKVLMVRIGGGWVGFRKLLGRRKNLRRRVTRSHSDRDRPLPRASSQSVHV
jgi:Calponin homology (CH) domain/Growth-Arrest-Specific Protein 2 Domain